MGTPMIHLQVDPPSNLNSTTRWDAARDAPGPTTPAYTAVVSLAWLSLSS